MFNRLLVHTVSSVPNKCLSTSQPPVGKRGRDDTPPFGSVSSTCARLPFWSSSLRCCSFMRTPSFRFSTSVVSLAEKLWLLFPAWTRPRKLCLSETEASWGATVWTSALSRPPPAPVDPSVGNKNKPPLSSSKQPCLPCPFSPPGRQEPQTPKAD